MLKVLKTFNAHNINDGTNYRAAIVNSNLLPSAKPVWLEQEQSDAVDSGAWTVETGSLAVYIRIVDLSNRIALMQQLKNWFKRGTQGALVVTFTDESEDFQKTCRVVNLVPDGTYPDIWIAQLETGATAWRAVSAETYVWNLTGTGGTHTETLPSTDDETRLSVTFQASGLPTVGYLYQNLLRIVPPSGVSYGLRPWRVEIDTAALIASTAKSNQINNGAGINDTTLTIPIDTPVGGGLTTGSGLCYVETEQILYTSISGGNINVATGGRGVNGTSAASHADNAVIKQSKMQADCQDLRVFLGDVETRRWIISPNNAATKVWFNVDLRTGFRLTLATAIAISGNITAMQFTVNATHQQMIAVMPDEGIVYHGTEWFSYRGRDAIKCKLLNPVRGLLSTTLQAHAVADSFDFIPSAVKFVYGNSAVGNPASDDIYYDETKPVFDLTNSDNTQWVYTAATLFFDPSYPMRPGSLRTSIQRIGEVSNVYTYKQDAASGDPAAGMKLGSFLRGGAWQIETAMMGWQFHCPGGIQEVSATGQIYRSSVSFPVRAGMDHQVVIAQAVKVRGKVKGTVYVEQWLNLWNETSPATISSWTAWTHNTVSVPSTSKAVRFVLSGSISALTNALAEFEVLTLTVKFTTANIPSAAFLGEVSNYQLAVTLVNNTNDDSIALDFPMRTSVDFVINGEAFTVTYESTNVHNALTLDDESRAVFVRLAAGGNDLQVSGTDVGALTATLSYYRRRL